MIWPLLAQRSHQIVAPETPPSGYDEKSYETHRSTAVHCRFRPTMRASQDRRLRRHAPSLVAQTSSGSRRSRTVALEDRWRLD
jgi:hypothetical protein